MASPVPNRRGRSCLAMAGKESFGKYRNVGYRLVRAGTEWRKLNQTKGELDMNTEQTDQSARDTELQKRAKAENIATSIREFFEFDNEPEPSEVLDHINDEFPNVEPEVKALGIENALEEQSDLARQYEARADLLANALELISDEDEGDDE